MGAVLNSLKDSLRCATSIGKNVVAHHGNLELENMLSDLDRDTFFEPAKTLVFTKWKKEEP